MTTAAEGLEPRWDIGTDNRTIRPQRRTLNSTLGYISELCLVQRPMRERLPTLLV